MARRKRGKRGDWRKNAPDAATVINSRGSPGHEAHTWRAVTLWGSQFPAAVDGALSFQYCPFCGLWMDAVSGEIAERPSQLVGK